MTVYVDEIRPCLPNRNWRWRESCHLFADSLDELHAFAARLGLRREWFQEHRLLDHYDLTVSKRAHAVRLGASEACDELVIAHFKARPRGSEKSLPGSEPQSPVPNP
jgi:hypothetical protein